MAFPVPFTIMKNILLWTSVWWSHHLHYSQIQCNFGTLHIYNMKIFKHTCTCKTLMYMSIVQYYIIIEKYHQCNMSFGHESQQSHTCPKFYLDTYL
jgi:hypothetical protein